MPKLKTKIEERIRSLLPELISQTVKNWIVKEKQASYGGKEIHLEHVLMAIEKVKMKRQKTILISDDGMFMDTFFNNQHYYDLSKDFSNQSQEFYEFLWSIITPQ